MLVKSGIMTQASGSFNGLTAGHNKAGMYLRGRGMMTNPATTRQVQVRSATTSIVSAWSATLTDAQRAAWELYAANTLTTGRLGDPLQISGQNWYTAANVPRIQSDAVLSTSLARIDAAPTTFDRGDPGVLSLGTISAGTSGINIDIAGTPDWAGAGLGTALVYVGRPFGAGRSFFRGPYRLAGAFIGNAIPITTMAISPPDVLARTGWSLTVGNKIAVAVRVLQADGRISSRIRLGPATVQA